MYMVHLYPGKSASYGRGGLFRRQNKTKSTYAVKNAVYFLDLVMTYGELMRK
jgi:hypothetical protein